MLSKQKINHFWEHGYAVAPSGISEALMQAMDRQLDEWIQDSRKHQSNYGSTMDGKARFDLEVGHTSNSPKLRRVANPADISQPYRDALWDSPITDMAAQLLGPDIKFHHCKLNIKLPGMDAVVHYHQDHAYDPHTNDDMLAVLLMLDDATLSNGCLKVVPGSHRTPYTHCQNGKFTGQIDPSFYPQFRRTEVPIEANRGDVCFIHTWMVHGSESNRDTRPRRLLICDYNAADCFELLPPAVPSPYSGMIVRGKPSPVARLKSTSIEIRTPYSEDSFFQVQGQPSARTGTGQ